MAKANNIFQPKHITNMFKKPWEYTERAKTAFFRAIVRLEDGCRFYVDKYWSTAKHHFKKIGERKVAKQATKPVMSYAYTFSPKDMSIFGADPNKVVETIKVCEALGNLAYGLGEPKVYMTEMQKSLLIMKQFLSALRSKNSVPTYSQYALFIKLQTTIERESLQIRTLLEMNIKDIKKRLNTLLASPAQAQTNMDTNIKIHAHIKIHANTIN